MLNEGQQQAKDLKEQGFSLNIIGGGGVGKSFLIDQLKTKRTVVFAPTGTAALLIGGVTCHKGFDQRVGVIDPNTLHKKVKPEVAKVLQKADLIVIDELSAVRYDMMQAIDYTLRNVMEVDVPFGGKQVITTSDPYQLLPFTGANEREMYKRWYGFKMLSYEYEPLADFKTVELTQPMRNVNEREARILQSLRKGDKYVRHAIDALNKEVSPFDPDEDCTWLCPTNSKVNQLNKSRYTVLQEKERVYGFEYTGSLKEINMNLPVGTSIKLKVGARVMLVTNDTEANQYVNGDCGVVMQLEEDCVFVKLDRNNEVVLVTYYDYEVKKYTSSEKKGIYQKTVAKLSAFPIKLGYALTLNKAQGQTLSKVVIDRGDGFFAHGQGYVGTSRTRDFSDIRLVQPLQYSDFIYDPRIKRMFG